ncbi:MAG: hypothetical protein GX684_06235 [Ruminococcaceae bacterium]|nr:hypothetical protein [Oscillospiraceae bacterium]
MAFLEVLASEKDKIEAYDWQFLERLNDPSYPSGKKQVALYDIIGDPTPELIFTKDNSKDGLEQAELRIYYYDEGSAIHVYSKDVDALAGGGHKYALFITENGDLYYYESPGIEFPVNTLEKLELQGDSVGPALTYEAKAQTDDTFKYSLNQKELSEADYKKEMAAITGSTKAVLQYNYYQQFLNERELTKTVSFSYDDIVYKIKSALKE